MKGKGIVKKDELNEYVVVVIYVNIFLFVNDYFD